jgi:Putative TM nitroreductase
MTMQRPIAELINARYSCRTYRDEPIVADVQQELAEFLAAHTVGPFGSQARFALVAASPGDQKALKRLGTYGFIKGATGFLVGAVRRAARDHEDYGYLVEQGVLFATGLGLGTCWLGGTFTKGSFADRMGGLARDEIMPAVVSLGAIGDDGTERIREREAGSRRLPASSLFFADRFGEPLDVGAAGDYAAVLEGVRMAPSASNKQPWRIVRRGRDWHFYLRRTKGYGKGSAIFVMLRLADLQRVDLGIAMCHFELAARELGLQGEWTLDEPDVGPLGRGVEYTATWRAQPLPGSSPPR